MSQAPDSAGRAVPQPVAIPPPNAVLLVLTSLPDDQSADRVAQALVDERLAACVNALGPCRSVYRWQGQVERAQEVPLLIKTTLDRYQALERRLRELHPYELPEILACRPDGGLSDYADWVIRETRPARGR